MTKRLFGVETEYALIRSGRPGVGLCIEEILAGLMSIAARRLVHLRDAESQGVYLANGARFYLDRGGHPEMTTPECSDPSDVVRYIVAGEQILTDLLAEFRSGRPEAGRVALSKCNVDYVSRTTWGCHESYLHRADPGNVFCQLIPHLASRIIYTGAGGFSSDSRDLRFTLSPRVWYLEQDVSDNSTNDRGIVHTKDESLSTAGYHRLHLICGESLCSRRAMWLKVATTALVVAMIEANVWPASGVILRSPVEAMRTFANDPACRATVVTTLGRTVTALEIQRQYLSAAEAYQDADFMPGWAPEACGQWRAILDQLEHGPETVCRTLDWAIKWKLYESRMGRRLANSLSGRPPILLPSAGRVPVQTLCSELLEIDMRFGQLGNGRGIFAALDRVGVLDHQVPGMESIEDAMANPPATGRGRIRGRWVRRLAGGTKGRYLCSWAGIWDSWKNRMLDLADPFVNEERWIPARSRDPNGPPVPLRQLSARDRRRHMHPTRSRFQVSPRASPDSELPREVDGFRVGDRVILGRHEAVNGDAHWAIPMEWFVGSIATIIRFEGRDRSGCHIVRVDIDDGRWVWRTCSLRRVPQQPAVPS